MKLRALVFAALCSCASGGAREPASRESGAEEGPPSTSERTFIKLADRRMALVLFAPPGTTEDGAYTVEGVLASDLSESYRTQLKAYRKEGAFEGFDDELLAQLARDRVDDVVVVEIAPFEPGAPIKGKVQVVLLGEEKRAWQADVPTSARAPASEPLRDFAHRAWLAVTRGWTDPGAHPPLDAVLVAQRLARKKRCDLAAPLLSDAIQSLPRGSVAEARRLSTAETLQAACERALALARREEEDARATYRLDLDTSGLAPKLREALAAAFARSALTAEVGKLTRKPAKLVVEPHAAVLVVRYDPAWYAAQVAGREKYVLSQRALYLDVWLPVIDALLDVRAAAQESLPAGYGDLIREMRATLRLTKLSGDYVDIDFVEKGDRVVFGDQLRVKVENRSEMTVATPAPGELRKRIFAVGPPEGARGETTDYGLLWSFFGLSP